METLEPDLIRATGCKHPRLGLRCFRFRIADVVAANSASGCEH
jgi:hypothetical protein